MLKLNIGDTMKNNYIKLNNNLNHLSLGNFFNLIKKESKNKSSAIQTEIFCIIFNIDSISDTTVNNYCTGYRSIGNDYKQIYLNYQKKYQKNRELLVPTINNLLSIIDGTIYDYKTIEDLNNKDTLRNLIYNTHTLVKNDIYVPNTFKKEFLNLINNKNYYEAICKILFFIILEKKQPLYESDLVINTIEEILKNTNLSVNDLKDYLSITFKEGINLIPSLKRLAKKNNPYALYELGNKEYNGEITGNPRYEEAYKYHMKAAEFNHPTSCWMIAHMILNKKIGPLQKEDIKLACAYLEKAISLNSISAINTKGLCYMYGLNPDHIINLDKAKECFLIAAKKEYVYAYNNLGRLYEQEKKYNIAFEYFLKSANEEESWACNKVGLYYYKGIGTKKDLNKSFYYFNLGISSPIKIRNPWNIYNIIKLFYLNGNTTIGIKKDMNKSLSLLNTIDNLKEANELYLYIYYEKYLQNKNKDNLNKLNYYLDIVNNSFSQKIKKDIEKELNNIKNYIITIDI